MIQQFSIVALLAAFEVDPIKITTQFNEIIKKNFKRPICTNFDVVCVI